MYFKQVSALQLATMVERKKNVVFMLIKKGSSYVRFNKLPNI